MLREGWLDGSDLDAACSYGLAVSLPTSTTCFTASFLVRKPGNRGNAWCGSKDFFSLMCCLGVTNRHMCLPTSLNIFLSCFPASFLTIKLPSSTLVNELSYFPLILHTWPLRDSSELIFSNLRSLRHILKIQFVILLISFSSPAPHFLAVYLLCWLVSTGGIVC